MSEPRIPVHITEHFGEVAVENKRLRETLEAVDRLLSDVMTIENLHIYEPVAARVTAALAGCPCEYDGCPYPMNPKYNHDHPPDAQVDVAVGLDYETDAPWVWTDDLPEPEDLGNNWLIRSVPGKLAERFRAAQKEINEAVKAVHEAAGYDSVNSRLVECCDSYDGEATALRTSGGVRDWWEPCRNCRWFRDEHAAKS